MNLTKETQFTSTVNQNALSQDYTFYTNNKYVDRDIKLTVQLNGGTISGVNTIPTEKTASEITNDYIKISSGFYEDDIYCLNGIYDIATDAEFNSYLGLS